MAVQLGSDVIKSGLSAVRLFAASSRHVHSTACQLQRMTQRTFEQGMPCPPMESEPMRLYSMRFCPYAQRSRLILAHKKIPYETVNVHLKRKPSWMFDRNPKGRVPILEYSDGRVLFESLVISQYLDEIYPQDPLIRTDPFLKARDQLMVDFCDRFMTAIYKMWFSQGTSEEGKRIFLKGFDIYEKELNSRLPDGPFFGGSKVGMADYMIWPWVERITLLDDHTSTGNEDKTSGSPTLIAPNNFPLLHGWMEAMYKLPAVQETMFDRESHMRFSRSNATDDPDYDMGLEDEPPIPTVA